MTTEAPTSQYEDCEEDPHIGVESLPDQDDYCVNGTTNVVTNVEQLIASLDDGAIFASLKKLVYNSIWKILCDVAAVPVSNNTPRFNENAVCHQKQGTSCTTRAVFRSSSSLFSDVVSSLSPAKRKVIEDYGFGSLLLLGKCPITPAFSRWVVNHVHVSTYNILLDGTSIPITPQTVHDVLGIPIGGKTIVKVNPDSGKISLLNTMNLTSLPTAKDCVENISKADITDEDLVRNFLIVAAVTFLCPNSTPLTEYLQPLVDVKEAKEWDWCKFAHYWLMKQVRKYHKKMKGPELSSTTMGGCIYIACVVYLDCLNSNQEQDLHTFPRSIVLRGDVIKDKSKIDLIQGQTYGKCGLMPYKSTCYYKPSGSRIPSPTCCIDSSNFKKVLMEKINVSLSSEVLEDLAQLYVNHATSPIVSAPLKAEMIIMDVIKYFHDCQCMLNECKAAQVTEAKNPDVKVGGNSSFTEAGGSKHGQSGTCCKDDDATLPAGNGKDAFSGDTEPVESSGLGGGSTTASVAETELVTPSQVLPSQ